MKATTEPVFPVWNRWLQSLRCTMFHSTWAGSFLHHKSYLKTWTLSSGSRSPGAAITARLVLFRGRIFFPQAWTQCITQRGKDVVQRERRSEWHQNEQKKGWQCTECIAMWGQKMPQTVKPLRISNHVKSVYIHCTQNHAKPLQLLQIHKFYLLKHYCIR